MAKYEAHITFDKSYERELKEPDTVIRSLNELEGWQYSAIDDDPIMGQKPYCYLTAYDESQHRLYARMNNVVSELKGFKIPALRTKIERIIYDSKTGVNEL